MTLCSVHCLLFQDPELCREAVGRILEVLKQRLALLVGWTYMQMQRPPTDKLSVAAMHVLLLAHAHFSLDSGLVGGPPVLYLYWERNPLKQLMLLTFD